MAKFCSEDCKALCDFCKYYRDFKMDMGLNSAELENKGYCIKREMVVERDESCSDFICFNLEFQKRKIVINTCFGGFELSDLGFKRLLELQNKEFYMYNYVFDTHERDFKYIKINEVGKLPVVFSKKDFGNSTDDIPADDIWYEYEEISSLSRDGSILVQVVEELKDKASGKFSSLEIVEIPADIDWEIESDRGKEWVVEKHKKWGKDL
ncbi:hypothetical protein THYS13_14920 [Thermoanaerobacter sp. YS13]|uniref:hypothetical protein n=1 Tax=Thermoanaerobacter sp. YS13 TaxID=1511746 RepID=UPI000573C523|nr:hypothetical protein [Thermoanaerobacter sp. YS13]KHO63368.1 hypothetical protein THYS13_14920 [Thermoanaerobacter sp. YS13]